MFKYFAPLLLTVGLSACTTDRLSTSLPRSQGEAFSGYNYVPLDPLGVRTVAGTGCSDNRISGNLLNALPDNAVRIAMREFSASGDATFGPASVGAKGHSYEVVLDYINADVTNIRFGYETSAPVVGARALPVEAGITSIKRLHEGEALSPAPSRGEFVVPVYVGIGLRLTAHVKVLSGKVNLASLGALAAAAEAEQISGSMIVQTLGITGPQVTSALPLPSELNATTVQNAILALGSVKAMVYKSSVTTPRVTGLYNPLGTSDPRIINMIVSELAGSPVEWSRACVAEPPALS